ncbi:toll/interleukin-1 receptor domain-containing protein [Streptomyces sp. V2]|uniref:TIR domain-containing protein n=1 Tax=Streptomyces niveiscabiei TaxID=164115 RepID=A0ABW9HVM2_9ACTN|nr:toll/interleukin-1 receptor domain-containing protein [Streptomyces sp. V2]
MTDRPPFFFTSYAERRADSDLVEQFHARLQREVEIKRGRSAPTEGFLNTGSLRLGQGWRAKIGTALGRTRFLVVLLTDDYLASPWCAREWAVVKARAGLAAPEEPVAILPLFWTGVSRELPQDVADLQLRMATLGAAYTDRCLVDLMRDAPQAYEKLVIGLTDHMIEQAATRLPEMDAESAASYPPAFGLTAPEKEVEEAAPEVKSTPVADLGASASPADAFKKTDLIEAFVRSPISGSRETYDLWLESVRLLVFPVQLAPGTDSGTLRNRVIALINFALRQKTPHVLLALAEALEELGDDEATHEVRRLVDLAVASRW